MWKTRIDLTGKKYGTLTVLEYVGNKGSNAIWRCVCECGKEFIYNKSNLMKIKSHRGCRMGPNFIDYVGQKIGKLTVIERTEDKINTYGSPVIKWKCTCECGEIVYRVSAHLKRGSCRCKKCKAIEEAKKFGHMEIRQHHWSSIQFLSKKRKIDFDITVEYAWKLYEEQNRQCALSGLPIGFAKTKNGHATGDTTASLDRIDSSKGYIVGNIQWLHKWVNLMKSDFSTNEFLDYCKKIVKYNEKIEADF